MSLKKIFILLYTIIFALLLSGCEPEQPTTNKAAITEESKEPAKVLFQDPIEPVLTELPSEAIAYWRSDDGRPMPLVLFSMHPFLNPIPDELKVRAKQLAATGSPEELKLHGSINRVDPVLLSQQTITAAIDANLIERILWFFPFQEPVDLIDLEHFREQLSQTDFFTEEEITQISLVNGIFSGEVRGLPILIIHPDAYLLDDETQLILSKPAITHFDLSYFKGLFIDEVKTPVYDLLKNTAEMLKELQWEAKTVTCSFQTEEGGIGLGARFILHNFSDLASDPGKLNQAKPETWRLREEALSAQILLKNEHVEMTVRKNAETAPDDPTVLYDLYNLLMTGGNPYEAIAVLDKAVEADPGYAYGYLETATFFANNQQFDLALELLEKAENFYPDNPFLLFNKAQILADLHKPDEAKILIQKLGSFDWSEAYHGQAQPTLQSILRQIENSN